MRSSRIFIEISVKHLDPEPFLLLPFFAGSSKFNLNACIITSRIEGKTKGGAHSLRATVGGVVVILASGAVGQSMWGTNQLPDVSQA